MVQWMCFLICVMVVWCVIANTRFEWLDVLWHMLSAGATRGEEVCEIRWFFGFVITIYSLFNIETTLRT